MSDVPTEKEKEVLPYTALAAGYDVVMEHVEYEAWAEYTHHIIQENHSCPVSILELGCGTGSFAFELQPLGSYRYIGTDSSAAMVRVAREKAKLYGLPIQFEVADFTNFRVDHPVDVAILLYDGMNYLLEEDSVMALLASVYEALKPGGLFFFDQSTPYNSINNEAFFEDEGEADGFSYVRHSSYDRSTRLHTTTFDLQVEGATYYEQHVQRAYDMGEIRMFLKGTAFEQITAFDGFSMDPPSESSERIHWLVRKPHSRG
jgi:SAM-dependent methyltransferase